MLSATARRVWNRSNGSDSTSRVEIRWKRLTWRYRYELEEVYDDVGGKRLLNRDVVPNDVEMKSRLVRRLFKMSRENEADELLATDYVPSLPEQLKNSSSPNDHDDKDDTSFLIYLLISIIGGLLIFILVLSTWYIHYRLTRRPVKEEKENDEGGGGVQPKAREEPSIQPQTSLGPLSSTPTNYGPTIETSVRRDRMNVIDKMMSVYSNIPLHEVQGNERQQSTPVPPLNLKTSLKPITAKLVRGGTESSELTNFKLSISSTVSSTSSSEGVQENTEFQR